MFGRENEQCQAVELQVSVPSVTYLLPQYGTVVGRRSTTARCRVGTKSLLLAPIPNRSDGRSPAP